MDELGAHGIHYKVQGHHHWISNLLLLWRHGPEALIVGIKVASMYHRVNRIDCIEILVDKNVGLLFRWQHTYDFSKAAATSPVVGEGMFRTQAKEWLRSLT